MTIGGHSYRAELDATIGVSTEVYTNTYELGSLTVSLR